MRLIQEYFLVSAGVQSIVRHYVKAGMNIREFDKKIAIHINDTHPALCVAELMRILVDDYNLEWNEAWTITRGTCAYTNHTILPEALETWNVDLFKALLPRIYMIIDEINRRHVEYIRARYPDNLDKVRAMSIIENNLVHMARLAIVGSHSVNGVARIHSDILKSTTLHDFYEYWLRMFNNKTNGITHRRWLMGANPELADLIDATKKDPAINGVSFFLMMCLNCGVNYERSILVRAHSTMVAEEIVSNAPLSLSPTNACVAFNSDAAVKMFADVKSLRGFGIVVIRVSPSVNE